MIGVNEMDMITLKRVMSEVVRQHLDIFYDYDESALDMSVDDLVNREMSKLATQNVLDYVNDHMHIQPVVDLYIDGKDYIELVMQDESNHPDYGTDYGIQYVDKLWPEYVCFLGSFADIMGSSTLSYFNICSTFVTVNGEFKFAVGKMICEQYRDSNENFMNLVLYKKSYSGSYDIGALRSVIPEEYDGVLYDI